MLNKSLLTLAMLTTFVAASEMEAILEVGRDNTELSAQSQGKIDATDSATDKLINEFKVVSKQVEGLKLYNAQKRIQIQAQLDLMDQYDEQLVQVVMFKREDNFMVILKCHYNKYLISHQLRIYTEMAKIFHQTFYTKAG